MNLERELEKAKNRQGSDEVRISDYRLRLEEEKQAGV